MNSHLFSSLLKPFYQISLSLWKNLGQFSWLFLSLLGVIKQTDSPVLKSPVQSKSKLSLTHLNLPPSSPSNHQLSMTQAEKPALRREHLPSQLCEGWFHQDGMVGKPSRSAFALVAHLTQTFYVF